MKKHGIWLLVCCLCILCSCSRRTGSFTKGIRDFSAIIQAVNEASDEERFAMGLLNEISWDDEQIEATYALDMTKLEEAAVFSCAAEAQICEIAFFKGEKQTIEAGITKRRKQIEARWNILQPMVHAMLDTAQQGELSSYVYFVIGTDAKKVVNYLQEEFL